MAKLGTAKRAPRTIKVASKNSPGVVASKWIPGAVVYQIPDASQRLITMVGASFNEPSYYNLDQVQPIFDPKMAHTGGWVNVMGMDARAAELISTAVAVANSANPQDLWIIAEWARTELNMRTTPEVLAAVGAANANTKPWARKYIPRIAQRADAPLAIMSAYMHMYGKPLPQALRRGLSDAIAKFNEWTTLRYQSDKSPSTKDMLLMVDRKKDWPMSKELFEFVVNGNILDPVKTPIAAARKAMTQKGKVFDEDAKVFIKSSGAPWEVVISQFGSRREVWEFLIQENLMGYMALLRNLNNFIKVGIGEVSQGIVAEKLRTGAETSKQLPFRFLTAREHVGMERWAMDAVDGALDAACANVPELPGTTAILVDLSGSMNSAISTKSKTTIKQTAGILAAMYLKKNPKGTVIYGFADRTERLQINPDDTAMGIVAKIQDYNLGGSTYAHLPLLSMAQDKVMVDRILILSDMQCYGCEESVGMWGYNAATTQKALDTYKTVNPDVFVHSIDLVGHGHSQVDPKGKVNLVSGWSEKVLNTITDAEGITSGVEVPTLEQLRRKYA